jgi:hypothetical protein
MEPDRLRLIELLVFECFERVHSCGHSVWMQGILEDGFVGFANMSHAELLRHCLRLGIPARESSARAADECTDGNFGDEDCGDPALLHIGLDFTSHAAAE